MDMKQFKSTENENRMVYQNTRLCELKFLREALRFGLHDLYDESNDYILL